MVLWGKIAVLRNVVKQRLRKTEKSAKMSSFSCVVIAAVKGSSCCGGSNKK
jgi:hypothetical protein